MDAITQFSVLTLTTIFAGAMAFGMAWAFLQGALRLMQPAATRRAVPARLGLVHGTRAVVQAMGRS